MIVYSYLTAVVCLEIFLVLIFLFLVLLKERENLIFVGVLWPVFQKWSRLSIAPLVRFGKEISLEAITSLSSFRHYTHVIFL